MVRHLAFKNLFKMKSKILYLEVFIAGKDDKTIIIREQKETNQPPVAVAVCCDGVELGKFIDDYE